MGRLARKLKREEKLLQISLQNEAMKWCREEHKKKKKKEKMQRRRQNSREKRKARMLMQSPEGELIKKHCLGNPLGSRVSNRLPTSTPLSDAENRQRNAKFQQDMIYYVSNDIDKEGLRVQWFKGTGTGRVGRSVKAKQDFLEGDFVAYYAYSRDGRGGQVGDRYERRWGELLTREEGFRREEEYERQNDSRCFMFFFRTGCIDATNEPPIPYLESRVGRLINHSRHNPNGVPGSGPNLEAKMYPVNGRPQIIFQAKRNITAGEFVDYDYGDQSRNGANTWLNATT